jgi:hypothetical protein
MMVRNTIDQAREQLMYEFIREVLGETGRIGRSCSKKVFSTRYGY